MLEQGALDVVAQDRMLTDASFIWAMLSTTHSLSGLVGVRLVRLTWLAERAAKCLHLPAREDLEKILPAQAGSPTTSPFITVEELRELPTGLNGQLPLLVVQASPINAWGTACRLIFTKLLAIAGSDDM